MRHAHELARKLPGKEVFSVGDLEGDIYEVLQECAGLGQEEDRPAHLLVRANLNRLVDSLSPCGKSEADEPALACNMIVAWRLQYLVHMGRKCPELPASSVFAEEEWRAALAIDRRAADPQKLAEPSLGELIRIIARFGGHLGRKNDAPPGAQCVWTGLARVRDFAIAIEVCRKDS